VFAAVVRNPQRQSHPPTAQQCRPRRRIAAAFGFATLLAATMGAVCDPSSIRVTNRLPDPVLIDDRGEVDADGFDALVAATEKQRGLGFIQRPRLELLRADDPRLASLRETARALEPCPRVGATQGGASEKEAPGRCFPDPGLQWVLCLAPPDLEQARRALKRLLDAQNYPRLARAAPALRGDPGVAIRSLLAASARSIARGSTDPAAAEPSFELFDQPDVAVERSETAEDACAGLADGFLATHRDREAPFRTPPLSTKQLVSSRAYRGSERPHRILGTPPALDGCELAGDESIGVARLLSERLAKGGLLPARALAGWQGDRGIRFECRDGARPWLYLAELATKADAAAFAAQIQQLMPAEFVGPSETLQIGRRVVVFHDLDRSRARNWATSVATVELAGLDGLE